MTEKEKKELELKEKKEIKIENGEPLSEGLYFSPDVDISETDEAVVLYMDLPGVTTKDVNIDFKEGILSMSAKVDSLPTHFRSIYSEYQIGGYHRRFNIGSSLDPSKIEAKMNNGMLTLTVPKAEEHKPRKIEITN